MRRSNRCRWILPFSIFSPSSSFFLVSNQNSIRNQFSLFRQNSSIKSSLRSSHLSHFLMNHGQVNAAFSIRKSVQRIEEKQKSRAERKVSIEDYRRKRRISTLSRSRRSDLDIIDINKMYEDVWNLRQHTLMSTVERFIVSSVAR